MAWLRRFIGHLAAIGAVRRRGINGLQAYGGSVGGEGHVIHKSDDPEGRWKAGDVTQFNMEGRPGSRYGNDRSTPA